MKHVRLAADFYDEIVNLHHEEFNYKEINYAHWLDLLISKLKPKDKVLDLGCGNGRAVKYFIDHGIQGIGIDVSEEMLKLSRKNVPKGKFYKQEFTKIKFKPNTINATVSFFAINHIPKKEFEKILMICKKILKKDGLLLLGLVKGEGEGFWKGFYETKMELYGAGYGKKELTDLLKKYNYQILKVGVEHFKGKHFEEDQLYVLAKVKK